jgi:hypothetical protein
LRIETQERSLNKSGPSFSIRFHSLIVRRGIGWGSTPSFFLAGLAAHPWGLLRSMSPSVRTLGWGWGFYGSPTFGTTRDLVHVAVMCPRACGHRSANAALTVAPRQPHAAELHTPILVRTLRGPTANGGLASCQAQLASPRICIWHTEGQ